MVGTIVSPSWAITIDADIRNTKDISREILNIFMEDSLMKKLFDTMNLK
jgi:hypothetical protein